MEQRRRVVDPTVGRRGARRVVAGGVVGTVMVGTALLGGGTASALDCDPLPLVGTVLYQQCKALGATAGRATGAAKAVPRTAASAAAPVLPRVVPRSVPRVVPRATRPVTGLAGGTVGTLTGGTKASVPSGSSASSGSSSRSSAGTASAAAPATAAAPGPAPAPAVVPAVAPASFTMAFDTLPASFLGSAVPGTLAFPTFSGTGVAGAYDPGLLLTSSAPVRALTPSRVTTGSSAVPLSFLGEDGRIQTPVLLSVLTVAVVAALGVRAGVLRRARRRRPARTA